MEKAPAGLYRDGQTTASDAVADSKSVNARVDKACMGDTGTNPLRAILGETCLSVISLQRWAVRNFVAKGNRVKRTFLLCRNATFLFGVDIVLCKRSLSGIASYPKKLYLLALKHRDVTGSEIICDQSSHPTIYKFQAMHHSSLSSSAFHPMLRAIVMACAYKCACFSRRFSGSRLAGVRKVPKRHKTCSYKFCMRAESQPAQVSVSGKIPNTQASRTIRPNGSIRPVRHCRRRHKVVVSSCKSCIKCG